MLNANRNRLNLVIVLLCLPLLGAGRPEGKPATWGGYDGESGRSPAAECLPDRSRGRILIPLPEPWRRMRELYLLGRCHLDAGHNRLAARYFRQGLLEDDDLPSVWRLNLFSALLAEGAREQSLVLLGSLLRENAPGVRAQMRGKMMARLDALGGVADPNLTAHLWAYADILLPQVEDYDLLSALYTALAAQPASGAGEDGTLGYLSEALWSIPRDRDSAQAWAKVMADRQGHGAWPPSPDSILRRVNSLHRLRLHEIIRREIRPPNLPEMPADTARALGRRYFAAMVRGKAYDDALAELARPEVRAAFAWDEAATLTQIVRLQLRARRPKAAAAALAQLEQVAPGADALPRYYLEFARRARRTGRTAEMERWCRRVFENFPSRDRTAAAYWILLWQSYRGGDRQAATRWAEAALAADLPLIHRPRFLYWLGRIRQSQGQVEDAWRAWDRLRHRHPTNYYGLLAAGEDLRQSAAVESGKGIAAPPLPDEGGDLAAVWAEPELRRGLVLLAMGETELGEAELAAAIGKPFPQPALLAVGQALHRAGGFYLMQRFAVNYFLGQVRSGASPDEDLVRLFYPLAYAQSVWEETTRRAIDPYFVLAVMREESHFRVDADSSAGAKGLMQLMPATADMVARWNRSRLHPRDLLTPEVNIATGVQYLAWLFKKFRGNPVYAAAGYNAGPSAVRRWIKRMPRLDLDEFIEEIPYLETRNYVKKVIRSALLYRRLYGVSPAKIGPWSPSAGTVSQ